MSNGLRAEHRQSISPRSARIVATLETHLTPLHQRLVFALVPIDTLLSAEDNNVVS